MISKKYSYLILAVMIFVIIIVIFSQNKVTVQKMKISLPLEMEEEISWLPDTKEIYSCRVIISNNLKIPDRYLYYFDGQLFDDIQNERIRKYNRAKHDYIKSLKLNENIRIYFYGLSKNDKKNINDIYRKYFLLDVYHVKYTQFLTGCKFVRSDKQ
jgi:hypothetical protein